MSDELTNSQENELEALLMMDREAVIRVVSDLRLYRAAVQRLLSCRYSDGEVDGAMMHEFVCTVEEIEDGENPIIGPPFPLT